MNEKHIIYENEIIESSKNLINPNVYKFLFYLFKHIFLNQRKTKSAFNAIEKMNSWIKIINEKIILIKKNFISVNYSFQNFKNIIKFVKKQNELFAADIIENILIIIFSFGFKTNKENTFEKYLYNNLDRIKKPENTDIAKWFDNAKFKPEELKDFKKLLNEGPYIENIEKNINLTELQKHNIFFKFLIEIHYEKKKIYEKTFKNKNNILKGNIKEKEKEEETYCLTDKIEEMKEMSSYSSIDNDLYHEQNLDKLKNNSINITRSFFISVFIYYQNKNSPLMKYINKLNSEKIKEEKVLADIPFVYDFSSGAIRPEFAKTIMASARLDPKINSINMSKNILKEKGLFELSKILIFNKYIKIIDFHKAAIKSIYLDYLKDGFNVFDNYYVEELNISSNYIKEDSCEILGKILSHLKGLKSINLSMNHLGSGINYFLIVLKNLYRYKKIKVENLYLNDCILDYSSFYELGNLLKCKYCKLKNLILNKNEISQNYNFLKRLKRNKSLIEIYFNNCNIGINQTDNILRIISNTNIQCLYLHNNKINNFNNSLRILYRTKLIKKKIEKNNNFVSRIDSLFYNLDLSNNDIFCKNTNHINLLNKIIKDTTLYCLDFSHVLFGKEPNKYIIEKTNNEYKREVINLRDKLNEKQKKYEEIIELINIHEINIAKLKEKEYTELSEKLEKEIDEIISNVKAKYPVFLREKVDKMFYENIEFFEGKDEEDIKENLRKYFELKFSLKSLERVKQKKEKRKLIII